jgi:hypothetical protein
LLSEKSDLQKAHANRTAGIKTRITHSTVQIAGMPGVMEAFVPAYTPAYTSVNDFGCIISIHAGGEASSASSKGGQPAAAGSGGTSRQPETSPKAALLSGGGAGPAGDDGDTPRKPPRPPQPPVPHPDERLFAPTNRVFQYIPERLWPRAAAEGWRDLPWSNLGVDEQMSRRVPGDEAWLIGEIARLRPFLPRPDNTELLGNLSQTEREVAEILMEDVIWPRMYASLGGEPIWAAFNVLGNLWSRHHFRASNFRTVFENMNRNVDISSMLQLPLDILSPSSSYADRMPPLVGPMFIRRAHWCVTRDGSIQLVADFIIGNRYVVLGEEEDQS